MGSLSAPRLPSTTLSLQRSAPKARKPLDGRAHSTRGVPFTIAGDLTTTQTTMDVE